MSAEPPSGAGTAAGSGDAPIAPRDHPLRSFVALFAVLALGALAVALLRPAPDDPAEALLPHLGVSLRLVIRTEPGAAPDDREWLAPLTIETIEEREGVRSARIVLEGMTSVGEPDAPARIWIPLDRILEAWVGPDRVFRRPE